MPPETKILYEDCMPHYMADRTYKRLLERGLDNQVSMDRYLCAHSGVIPTFVEMVQFVSRRPLCLRLSRRYMHVHTRVRRRP